MAKPDNREDNVDHLQEHIQNTVDNLEEAEEYLDEHAEELNATERVNIETKNDNRRESIDAFRDEVKDEAKS